MTKYKCGHESKPVIVDDNELSVAAWFDWKETSGYEGDNSKCWECWCENGKN